MVEAATGRLFDSVGAKHDVSRKDIFVASQTPDMEVADLGDLRQRQNVTADEVGAHLVRRALHEVVGALDKGRDGCEHDEHREEESANGINDDPVRLEHDDDGSDDDADGLQQITNQVHNGRLDVDVCGVAVIVVMMMMIVMMMVVVIMVMAVMVVMLVSNGSETVLAVRNVAHLVVMVVIVRVIMTMVVAMAARGTMSSVRLEHAGNTVEDAVAMATTAARTVSNDNEVNDVAHKTHDGRDEHNPRVKLNLDTVHNLVAADDCFDDEPGHQHPDDQDTHDGAEHFSTVVSKRVSL